MKILGKPRIAITTDGLLQNVYFTGHTENPLERAFFKGVVTKGIAGNPNRICGYWPRKSRISAYF